MPVMRLVRDPANPPDASNSLSYAQFDSLLTRATDGPPDRELLDLLNHLDSAQIAGFLDTLDDQLAAMFAQANLIGRKIDLLRKAAQQPD